MFAYDDLHRGDFHDRAHKLAQQDVTDVGRNVWHIAVARAEKAEAEVTRMRPVVDAALHWAEQWSRDADNKALEAAVDAYRAGGGK